MMVRLNLYANICDLLSVDKILLDIYFDLHNLYRCLVHGTFVHVTCNTSMPYEN